MLNLNLLPPPEKVNVAYEMRSRAVVAVATGFIAIIAVALILVLPTIFFTVFQKSEAVRAVALETENQMHSNLATEAEVLQSARHLADTVLGADRKRFSPSLLFESIIRDTPPTLRLEALRVHPEGKELTIRGFAPTRSSLLTFLANLQKDSLIAKASSPVANLIKETDITFSISATVR